MYTNNRVGYRFQFIIRVRDLQDFMISTHWLTSDVQTSRHFFFYLLRIIFLSGDFGLIFVIGLYTSGLSIGIKSLRQEIEYAFFRVTLKNKDQESEISHLPHN